VVRDSASAKKIAENIFGSKNAEQKLVEFSRRLDPDKKIIFVPVLNIEQNNRLNELPNALAHALSSKFPGSEVSTDVLKNESRAKTGAALDERTGKVITFDGEITDKNAQIVIVDDNFTSGDTVLSLYQRLLDTGSNDVRGILTFSASRYGTGLKIDQSTIDKLKNRTNLSTEQIEEIIGNEIEYLTEAEANQIISFAHAKGRLISIYAPEGSKTLDKILPDPSVRAKATLVAESSEYSIAQNSDSPYSSKSVKFSVNSDDNKDGNWTASLDKVSKDAQGIIVSRVCPR